MVPSSRTTLRIGSGALDVDDLQPLNVPRLIRVTCDAQGRPQTVLLENTWVRVTEIVDEWRVVEEWWRVLIRRRYLQLLLANDRLMTIFEDLEDSSDERWYRQHADTNA